MAQQFSSAHWQWTINLEGTACPNIPCTPSFAMARDKRKHLLVCRGMKLDMIHMATQNLVMDAFLRKKSMIQMLADSMTMENAEQVYPTMEDFQRSIRKQQSLMIPEEYICTRSSHQYFTLRNFDSSWYVSADPCLAMPKRTPDGQPLTETAQKRRAKRARRSEQKRIAKLDHCSCWKQQ